MPEPAETGMIAAVRARLEAPAPALVPKHRVLHDAILDAIASGEWRPGAQLPTEKTLSNELPFSVGTVQKAYGELARRRIVVRSRGRGSFVAASSERQILEPWHCRFLGADGLLPVVPTILGWSAVPADWPGAALFGSDPPAIVRIDRRMSIGREFDVLSRFFTRDTIAAAILDRPPEQLASWNFKLTLLRELGIPIARITETISTPGADIWSAAGLQTPPHILVEATAFVPHGEVAYFQELFIPPNNRKLLFDTDLHL